MSVPTTRTRLRIISATSAIVAGVAWVAKDVGGRVSPDPDYWNCNSLYDYVLNGIDTVAFLVLGVTLVCLRELFRNAIGGRRAFLGAVAAAGFAVAGVANLLEHCADLDALGFAYVIGLMAGMVMLSGFILTLTRAPIPRWLVLLIVLGTGAGIFLFNQGGLIAFGGAWIVVGIFLVRAATAGR